MSVYVKYTEGIVWTGERQRDVELFLKKHGEQDTYQHTMAVVHEARGLAALFRSDVEAAVEAALLHDVSNVIPHGEMMALAESAGIPTLQEEYTYPRIVHQKLSRDMAEHIFGCTHEGVLRAIECHTTLKAGATLLDLILFAADKLSWDMPGAQRYQAPMRERIAALDLEGAVLIYLNDVWAQRDKLRLVHPWLIEAREAMLAHS